MTKFLMLAIVSETKEKIGNKAKTAENDKALSAIEGRSSCTSHPRPRAIMPRPPYIA